MWSVVIMAMWRIVVSIFLSLEVFAGKKLLTVRKMASTNSHTFIYIYISIFCIVLWLRQSSKKAYHGSQVVKVVAVSKIELKLMWHWFLALNLYQFKWGLNLSLISGIHSNDSHWIFFGSVGLLKNRRRMRWDTIRNRSLLKEMVFMSSV